MRDQIRIDYSSHRIHHVFGQIFWMHVQTKVTKQEVTFVTLVCLLCIQNISYKEMKIESMYLL